MATLTAVIADVRSRLKDAASPQVFTTAELTTFIADAVTGLYPALYTYKVGTTTASAGPLQQNPVGGLQFYAVSVQNVGSTRARPIRGWHEGAGQSFIPKTNISGQTLVWAWSAPFAAPIAGPDELEVPLWGLELVKIRAEITALEQILTNRVKNQKYFASSVREGVTEQEIDTTLNALHASMEARIKHVVPLPQKVG